MGLQVPEHGQAPGRRPGRPCGLVRGWAADRRAVPDLLVAGDRLLGGVPDRRLVVGVLPSLRFCLQLGLRYGISGAAARNLIFSDRSSKAPR